MFKHPQFSHFHFSCCLRDPSIYGQKCVCNPPAHEVQQSSGRDSRQCETVISCTTEQWCLQQPLTMSGMLLLNAWILKCQDPALKQICPPTTLKVPDPLLESYLLRNLVVLSVCGSGHIHFLWHMLLSEDVFKNHERWHGQGAISRYCLWLDFHLHRFFIGRAEG